MLTGYLVSLGDDTIDPGDSVSNGATTTFDSATSQYLGSGSVKWTGPSGASGRSGDFYLAENGDVFFVSNSGAPTSRNTGGTANVQNFSGTQPPPPCFVAGTLISTPDGLKPVENLKVGELVRVRGNAVAPIVWTGYRVLDAAILRDTPKHRPIELDFGTGQEPLRVSGQHGIGIAGPNGTNFARATQLEKLGFHGVRQINSITRVAYHHILLPRHALVQANGVWCESFWPGPRALAGLAPHDRLAVNRFIANGYGKQAAPYAKSHALRKLSRNGMHALICQEASLSITA